MLEVASFDHTLVGPIQLRAQAGNGFVLSL
jgi:hypothetical protein